MTAGDDWSSELALLRRRGIVFAAGLSHAEFERIEEILGLRFPPDLRAFLACALPVGSDFPDWRALRSDALLKKLAWPFEGIAFDIERNAFWWEAWGPRPAALREALAVAKAAVESAPRLIPIYSHRYIPAEPEVAGNPVFSVYQTDIIYYGNDLPHYLQCEFEDVNRPVSTYGIPRRIRFWTDLVEGDI